jgi:hypothetical protein
MSSDLDPEHAVELLLGFVRDPGHGWSIGSFCAVAEFSRAVDEKASLSLCIERASEATHVILDLGPDRRSLREEDRGALLFDIGVGCGAVRLCVRTRDLQLIGLLRESAGCDLVEVLILTSYPNWSSNVALIPRTFRFDKVGNQCLRCTQRPLGTARSPRERSTMPRRTLRSYRFLPGSDVLAIVKFVRPSPQRS